MSVSIKRDRATGKNLGYGFVKLSSHQEARTAKEAMQVRLVQARSTVVYRTPRLSSTVDCTDRRLAILAQSTERLSFRWASSPQQASAGNCFAPRWLCR